MEGLAECEDEMMLVENEVERYKILKQAPVLEKRDQLLDQISGFWSIVLSQHSDFANYIRASDFKYIDAIEKVIVRPLALSSKNEDPRNFEITFRFREIEGDLIAQTVTKKFTMEKDVSKLKYVRNRKLMEDEIDSEYGFLTSDPVEVKWPKLYDDINPDLIENKAEAEGKKKYRTGMKTFFAWFRWTGLKPGKEFPNGAELANLFNEELYPYCVKYYTEAQSDVLDESVSDSNSESDAALQLDLSEEEGEGEDQNNSTEPAFKKRRNV